MKSALYRDASKPVEKRVADLLSRLTLEEKVGQLNQLDGRGNPMEAIRQGHVGSVLCVLDDDTAALQRAALDSRLGIPLICGVDAIHGHSYEHGATILPTQLALSCAWSTELAEQAAHVCAVEMAYTGAHWTFSPVCCLPRDLRWGRVNETFGEDPLLIGRLAAATVHGYQGDDLAAPESIAACVKHYAGYGESVGGRDASESEHSRRKLRALFLPPFHEALVTAKAATVMIGYQPIDGVPCTINRWLLHDVLREEWGWDGVALSDWDNVGHLVHEQKVCASYEEASRKALLAGLDMAMSTPKFHAAVVAEVQAGRIPLAVIDAAVRRVLTLKFRMGLLENPRLHDPKKKRSLLGCKAHRQVALQAARESAVLLTNRGLLPLDPARLKRVAVIGPHADNAFEQLGDWSLGASNQTQGSRHRHPRAATVTIRDGLERRLQPAVSVDYAEGCGITEERLQLIPRAVAAAQAADVAILVLGDADPYAGEFKSTATLELMGGQKALFEAVRATGTPVVVVFMASKPLAIPELAKSADALLCIFNPGMAGGTAVAEIVCGDVNPIGKLSVSFPHHVGQLPVHYQRVNCQHGTYADLPGIGLEPLFAFGYGLSYTTWRYSGLRLQNTEIKPGKPVVAEISLTNTGDRAGTEIVQCYLRDLVTSATWPSLVLVDYQRVQATAGEKVTVRFEIPYDNLAMVDAEGCRVVEPGDFELLIGASSRVRDLQGLTFKVCK